MFLKRVSWSLAAMLLSTACMAAGGVRTVAFLGGSITEMEGYRPRMMRYFREKFPGEETRFISAGVSSTCSTTGAFRFRDEVLAKGVPDVLFVDAAVNDDQDSHATYRRCVQGMEGIVRQALAANPKMRIVIVLFVNSRELQLLKEGKDPVPYAAHRAVARHYGVEVADVGLELAESEKKGEFGWKDYRDCHPSPAGNDFATAVIRAAFERAPGPRKPAPLPAMLDAGSFAPAGYIGWDRIKTKTEGWMLSRPVWSEHPKCGVRTAFRDLTMFWSKTPGGECSFAFEGTFLGAYMLSGSHAGMLEVSIDGGEFRTVDLFTAYSRGLYYPHSRLLAEDLEPGRHTAVVRLSEKHSPASLGTEAHILHFVEGGYTEPVSREQGALFSTEGGVKIDVVPEKTINYGTAQYTWERIRRGELLKREDAACGWEQAKARPVDGLSVAYPKGDRTWPTFLVLSRKGTEEMTDEMVAKTLRRGYAVARLDVTGLDVASAAKTAVAAYDLLRREPRVDTAHVGVIGFGRDLGRAAYLAGAHELRFALAATTDAALPQALLALQAPHLASIGVTGADPVAARRQFDECVAATPAWYIYGLSGLDIKEYVWERGLNYGGTLEFFRRVGKPRFDAYDLNRVMDFCDWHCWRNVPYEAIQLENLPELLVSPKTGKRVTTREEWEKTLKPEIIDFYERNFFGKRPVEKPEGLVFEPVGKEKSICGGKGVRRDVRIRFKGKYGEGSFRATAFVPTGLPKPCPGFIGTSCDVGPDLYKRTFGEDCINAAISRGYALVGYWAQDYAVDMPLDDELRRGWRNRYVFALYEKPEEVTKESWGAISAWAWGASRVLDWLETMPDVDAKHIGVAGNSRLGKTALWAGVTDERFAMVCPNCSGCLGARLSHINLEAVERIGVLSCIQPFWFCENVYKWMDTDRFELPYDQHQLAACVAPRLLAVGEGSDDVGTCPRGSFLMAKAASPAWALYGKQAIAPETPFPQAGEQVMTDGVGYHLRPGGHYLNVYNWNRYMDFADRHGWNVKACPAK